RNALAAAHVNTGIKVSFSPYFFSNLSLYLFLHNTRFVTSASTIEVTCGEICFDNTIFSAISLRIRSISTTSSPSQALTSGAFTAGRDGASGDAGVVAGLGAAA